MAEFTSLEIGKRALIVNKSALDLTSNNIANVNTPGYSRRTPVISETQPLYNNGKYVGTGVTLDKLRSFRQEYYDREIRNTNSRLSGYESNASTLQKVQSILAEPSENGINELVAKFFNSFNDLAAKPEDIGLRNDVLGQAQTLVDRFHITASQLQDTRNDSKSSLDNLVTNANGLISDIAGLNKDITQSVGVSSSQSQTYIDQRELKIEDLSKLFNVTVTNNPNGSANVFLSGVNLVTDNVASKLKMQENINSVNGEKTIQILKLDDKDNVVGSVSPSSGEAASLLNAYNVTLDDLDTSGGFSVAKQLNDYTNAIVQKVNSASINGFGLDDTGTNPPARSFFTPTVGSATAFTIDLSADIQNQPRNIPLSNAAGQPGDGTIARQIARIANDPNFLDAQNPTEYYSAYLGKIGNSFNDATNGQKTTQLVSDQLSTQRDSVVGVNLDEEAVNLIKYQKAFEAASRVVNTTSELLTTVVNLGK